MKNNKLVQISLLALFLVVFLTPLISFAQADDFDNFSDPSQYWEDTGDTNTNNSSSGGGGGGLFCNLANNPKVDGLINYITCLISRSIIPLIFVLAFAMFLWGVVQYVINSSEEAKREKGRQFMLWGVIALFVMFAVWGLVAVLGNTFNIDVDFIPQVKD